MIKDIWDLAWHLDTRMKLRTDEQNWDLFGTISGLWFQLGTCPKLGPHYEHWRKAQMLQKVDYGLPAKI